MVVTMIKDFTYAVIGLGRTGVAVCKVLSDLGATVLAFDVQDKDCDKLSGVKECTVDYLRF